MDNKILYVENISKSFGGVQALNNVDFDLNAGEIHAIVGENGAGKSTLIKIICGLYSKDNGNVFYENQIVNFFSNIQALKKGIGLVPQEIQLVPGLTVAENIMMGKYPVYRLGFFKWKDLYKNARDILKIFDIEHLLNLTIKELGTGQRQLVEILKTLVFDVKVLAFDEPTSALSEKESKELFVLIKNLKSMGISSIYVSHRLDEIFGLADRVTVLKDGVKIGVKKITDLTKEKVISMMVGREVLLYKDISKNKNVRTNVMLEVKNLKRKSLKMSSINFKLFSGEILGFFGIVGSGRTETIMSILGLEPKVSGDVFIKDQKVIIKSPIDSVKLGIGLIPENRILQGVILKSSIKNNISLPFINRISKLGFIKLSLESKIVKHFMDYLRIKASSEDVPVSTLSGGNQQKVAIAKWLAAKSEIIIFDEPTHGIDVGTKAEIYKLITGLAKEGKAIIVISSELLEVINVCDRILIFKDNNIVHEINSTVNLMEEDVIKYCIQ